MGSKAATGEAGTMALCVVVCKQWGERGWQEQRSQLALWLLQEASSENVAPTAEQ